MGTLPSGLVLFGAGTLADEARAMAGGEGGGFIEEEKLSMAAGGHDGDGFVFVVKLADEPRFTAVDFTDLVIVVMDDAAVAHEGAVSGVGDDVTVGGDTILFWHLIVLGLGFDIEPAIVCSLE